MNYNEFRKLQKCFRLSSNLHLNYIKLGKGSPILLIHGIPDWSYLWSNLIESLSKRHTVYLFDMVGFGYSDKRDCFDRSVKIQADIAKEFLDKMKVKTVDLVAHNTGGSVALILALKYPKLVKRLTLINSVCYDNWPIEPMLALANPKLKDTMSAKDFVDKMWNEAIAPYIYRNEKRTKELREAWVAPYSDEEGKLSMIRNASSLNTNHTMELVPHLKKIKIPTLLLWGDEDKGELEFGKRLHNDISTSKFVRIPKAGHYALIDQEEVILQRTLNFLEC